MPYRGRMRANLEAFSLDEPGSANPFSARLAQENCWSVEYAQRVIQEYKRFLLLASSGRHPVTPSDAVDQVWHLHLTYTKSYWGALCDGLLGRPLHHDPSQGGQTEQARFRADYQQTLEVYRETFGEHPPEDIWPDVEKRFGASQRFVRVNVETTIVVPKRTLARAVGLTALAASVSALGLPYVLDLPSAKFVAVYLVLWAATFVLAFVVQRSAPSSEPERVPDLQAYEAAYLAGREPAVANAVIAQLVARGALLLNPQNSTLSKQGPLAVAADAVEKAAYDHVCSTASASLADAYTAAARAARDIGLRLRGLGFVVEPSWRVSFGLALMAPALASAKLASAIAEGKNFAPYIVLLAISMGTAFCYFRPPPVLSALGRAALARAKERYTAGSCHSTFPDVPLAVGVFGLTVLPELGLDGLMQPLGKTHEVARSVNSGACGSGACGPAYAAHADSSGGGCGCGGCGCGG